MLTWNVTYHCKPGKREEFFKAISALGVRAHSNSEAGNVKYDYFFDAQDPDALLLVETWTEPALQQAHCQTEIFARLQALKTEFCESVTYSCRLKECLSKRLSKFIIICIKTFLRKLLLEYFTNK